ncbi:MAG: MarR family winged helix-turn-helix transcriptional regulator [Clostridium sp.]|nr:MarR family winged helix-turn-helix transcriptional regulator [Clostridium sp.]
MQEIESLMMINLNKFRKLNERKLETVMKKYDLRKIDMDIIIYLATYKDMRTAKDIASMEIFTKGHISQSIKRLKERGYITVSQDENDLRMQNLEISESTNAIIKEVCTIKEALEKSVFDGVTEEEMETMKTVFRKICSNINGIVG